MDKRKQEEAFKFLVDDATEFDKSLKELKRFSSQLHHSADYYETAFLSSQDKILIMETTKEYICRAVVAVVDRLGSISAILVNSISKSNLAPETEHRIDSLKQRIGTCQELSHKLALARLHLSAAFTRYYCHYITPPSKDSAMMSSISRDSASCSHTKSGKGNRFGRDELLVLGTYEYQTSLDESSSSDKEKNNELSCPANATRDYKNLLPVHDGLSILPKTEHSTFQFQEAQKQKRSTINWKLLQNKDIASLIRRGRRILT